MLQKQALSLTRVYAPRTLPVLNEREDMDQVKPTKQPQGKAKANFVRILQHDPRFAAMTASERATNAKLPLFRGTISAPEAPDQLFEYAVWDYTSKKDGSTFLAGRVRPLSVRATVEDHLLAAELSTEEAERHAAAAADLDGGKLASPHSIFIRTNARKVLKSDPRYAALPADERAANDARPLYWLKWQRDAGSPEVRGSLWDKAGRYGPFLDGNTQYPLSREQADALKAGYSHVRDVGDDQAVDMAPDEADVQTRRGARRERSRDGDRGR